ncbi:hypothetical protein BO70DRAFT_30382 [Aspergillus heteromorphus CBS 117.55]|uniref:Uncharacterized protein n=1 Tax=Aspergillus heteromorphus CBS 117.55 TaxID=1448321 RepID=A0A317WAC6_9EURO|nr:uncharacterized protein BO70DRAFT_30382 [Aspergillus heteromorphus CBS 117.55]PWY82845.1 hypothetical protein BO70DRAFT_30382 [Aspergillus heteromorphus CBS 117.55]
MLSYPLSCSFPRPFIHPSQTTRQVSKQASKQTDRQTDKQARQGKVRQTGVVTEYVEQETPTPQNSVNPYGRNKRDGEGKPEGRTDGRLFGRSIGQSVGCSYAMPCHATYAHPQSHISSK